MVGATFSTSGVELSLWIKLNVRTVLTFNLHVDGEDLDCKSIVHNCDQTCTNLSAQLNWQKIKCDTVVVTGEECLNLSHIIFALFKSLLCAHCTMQHIIFSAFCASCHSSVMLFPVSASHIYLLFFISSSVSF